MNKPQHIAIRRFRKSDLYPLLGLIHQTIDISYSKAYPARAVQFFKELHSEQKLRERGRKGVIFVVEESNEMIATGSLVDGEIFAVFVHPNFQQGGYGKSLMLILENEALEQGIIEVELSISLPSLNFYQGLGYEIIEKRSRDVGGGQQLDFWKAKKLLISTAP